jgi:hypothetical protein
MFVNVKWPESIDNVAPCRVGYLGYQTLDLAIGFPCYHLPRDPVYVLQRMQVGLFCGASSGLNRKHWTRLSRLVRNKHCRLLAQSVRNEAKKFKLLILGGDGAPQHYGARNGRQSSQLVAAHFRGLEVLSFFLIFSIK